MVNRCLFDMSDLDVYRIYYSINIYKYRFLENLPKKYIERFVLLVNEDNCDYLHKRFPQFEYLVCPNLGFIKRIPIVGRIISLINHRKFINKSNCEVFFSASNYDYNNILQLKLRKVIVIHDLKSIYERKGYWDARLHKLKARFYYKKLIKSSDIVIPISNYTKKDIERTFPRIDVDGKLKVIYNGVPFLEKEEPLFIDKNRPFILYVNTLVRTKNFETLLKAYNNCVNKESVDLFVVGKKTAYWEDEIEPLVKQYHLEEKVRVYSNLKDEELKYLYSRASLFVSPSLNEGFGYTPIEAAMNNCPVICTKCEALPDTTRGKVYYYENPMDENELAAKIDGVLNCPPSVEELSEIASFYKNTYSPNKQVAKILELLFPIK